MDVSSAGGMGAEGSKNSSNAPIYFYASDTQLFSLTQEGFACPSRFDGQIAWRDVQDCEYLVGQEEKTSVLCVNLKPECANTIRWKEGLSSWLAVLLDAQRRFMRIPLRCPPAEEEQFVSIFFERIKGAKKAGGEDPVLRVVGGERLRARAKQIAWKARYEKTSTFPFVTVGLIALLAFIFVAEIGFPSGNTGTGFTPSVGTLVEFGGLASTAVAHGEWWRMFTAPLLHAGLAHLVLNCIALFIIGALFERYIGSAWFAGIFACSALTGSAMSLALNSPNMISVGASGGIVGLFAATVVASFHLPDGRIRTRLLAVAGRALIPALLPRASAPGGLVIDYAGHFGASVDKCWRANRNQITAEIEIV